jgi:DNA-binding NarL/FixJ family response regulator
VLKLIAQGLSNQEIAGRLFVSEATVKTHINSIFTKIGARDRAQVVVYAFHKSLAGTPSEP